MELGAFSISLAVRDIKASKEFYEKLGFSVFAGVMEQNWLILKNGNLAIGLFQGMFDKNTLTFNPGWDSNAQSLKEYTDIRQLQKILKENGIQPIHEVDENTKGPGYLMLLDPDGNPILFDQHV